jgi:hypothetical protein
MYFCRALQGAVRGEASRTSRYSKYTSSQYAFLYGGQILNLISAMPLDEGSTHVANLHLNHYSTQSATVSPLPQALQIPNAPLHPATPPIKPPIKMPSKLPSKKARTPKKAKKLKKASKPKKAARRKSPQKAKKRTKKGGKK